MKSEYMHRKKNATVTVAFAEYKTYQGEVGCH